MFEILPILQWAFLACLVLVGIHCYLGLHIVSRGVIFVDLALAQIAALGSACALLFGYELHSRPNYLISLGFASLGALYSGSAGPVRKRYLRKRLSALSMRSAQPQPS